MCVVVAVWNCTLNNVLTSTYKFCGAQSCFSYFTIISSYSKDALKLFESSIFTWFHWFLSQINSATSDSLPVKENKVHVLDHLLFIERCILMQMLEQTLRHYFNARNSFFFCSFVVQNSFVNAEMFCAYKTKMIYIFASCVCIS